MNTFDFLIIDLVLILFPLMLYFIYIAYLKVVNTKVNNLYLDFTLISSYYLVFRLGGEIDKYLILLDILLTISYIKKRFITSIILSILLIISYFNIYNVDIYILIFEYIIYYLIYKILKDKKLLFTNIVGLIKIIFYNLFITNKITIIFYPLYFIIINLVIYMIIKVDTIVSLYSHIKEIEKEKRITDSLFKITHEIKNPIAVCKGYIDMFDINNINHFKKYIPIIKSEINRVLTLLEDYLSISKIKIEKEEMDICILLEDVVNCFKPIIKNKKIKIEASNIDDEVYIKADYNRLKQTLVNIIKNSVESIDKKGLISVQLESMKDKIMIIIKDNGIGINDLSKIKEAFYTTKESGTGLGIYLSNEIIKAHGGKLTYYSKEFIGTKVVIELPL